MSRPRADRRVAWLDRRYATAAVVLAAAAAALGLLAARHQTFVGDGRVSAGARALGEAFAPAAWLFNEADALVAVAVLVPLGAALVHRRRLDAVLVVALALLLRTPLDPLKALVGRTRPAGDFAVLDVVGDSSFPSGHTMTAVVVFGAAALLIHEVVPMRWVWPLRTLAAVAVALVATSRMWAGVHWFSDTYGALLWGGTALALAFTLRPAFARLVSYRAPAKAVSLGRRSNEKAAG